METRMRSVTIPDIPALNEPADWARSSSETLMLLSRRRSTPIGLMGEPGPDPEDVDVLLKLAARVPDHGKLGPWRFIVIADEGRQRAGETLAKVIAGDEGVNEERLAVERARFLRAPICVVVVSTAAPHRKIPEWEQTLSAAAVCFNLLLVAHAAGYAGAWLTEWPTYDERAREALGLAPQERIAGFVYLGTATESLVERIRPDLEPRISRF
jgi:nitroreductase